MEYSGLQVPSPLVAVELLYYTEVFGALPHRHSCIHAQAFKLYYFPVLHLPFCSLIGSSTRAQSFFSTMDTAQRRRAQLWPIRAEEWIRKHHTASDDPPPPPTYLHLSIATVLQHAISQGGGGCSWNAKHQILAYGSALVSESLCREILYPPRSPWSEFTVTADPPSSFSKLFMPLTLQCATQISQSLSIPTFLLLCGFETLTTPTDYFFTLKHKLSFTHHWHDWSILH